MWRFRLINIVLGGMQIVTRNNIDFDEHAVVLTITVNDNGNFGEGEALSSGPYTLDV